MGDKICIILHNALRILYDKKYTFPMRIFYLKMYALVSSEPVYTFCLLFVRLIKRLYLSLYWIVMHVIVNYQT